MRPAVLALALTACTVRHAAPDPPWPEAQPSYPLVPAFRSATGGPIHVTTAGVFDSSTVDVPYARGLTLRAAVAIAGMEPSHAAILVRTERDGEHRYDVPLSEIAGGTSPDPTLAPGDEVIILDNTCPGICD